MLGPLFGAAVLAFTSWRGIFLINCGGRAGAGAGACARCARRAATAPGRTESRRPGVGADDGRRRRRAGRLGRGGRARRAPARVALHRPHLRRVLHPGRRRRRALAVAGRASSRSVRSLVVVRRSACCRGARSSTYAPAGAASPSADLAGSAYLAIALGGVVLAFATADPEVSVFSAAGPVVPRRGRRRARRSSSCTCAAPPTRSCRAARSAPARRGARSSSACSSAGRSSRRSSTSRSSPAPPSTATRSSRPRSCCSASSSPCPIGAVLGRLAGAARSRRA